MKPLLWQRIRRNLLWIALLLFVWLTCSGQAQAGGLSERLAAFPNWHGKPPVSAAAGDLVYPDWIAGTWQMTTTLVDMAAPLAPAVTTPGFEGNRQFLQQPVVATVRFIPAPFGDQPSRSSKSDSYIVSDRAFNGLSLGRAYLGKAGVKAVRVDPDNPNRQITFLKDQQQLISTVTGRAVETPDVSTFITTEVFQQYFRGLQPVAYLNEVESTTAYHRLAAKSEVVADQITAVYLSPQDPDYFKALAQPVALYRYRLLFQRAEAVTS